MNNCSIQFHNLQCFLDKNRTSLSMEIYQENYLTNKMLLQYQTRKFFQFDFKELILINEIFDIQKVTNSSFIKITIRVRYKPKDQQVKLKEKFEFYIIVDDLMEPNLKLEMNDTEYLVFNFSVDNLQKKIHKVQWQPLAEDQKAGLIESVKTNDKFLKTVTPIRRLKNDLELWVLTKDIKRDMKILGFYLLFTQIPLVFLFVFLYLLIFTDKPLQLRTYIAKNSQRYFDNSESNSIKIKKNNFFVYQTQLQDIKNSKFLKQTFYKKQRQPLYELFQIFPFLFLIPIPIIFLWNTKLNFFLAGIGIFCAKYQQELKEWVDNNIYDTNQLKKKLDEKFNKQQPQDNIQKLQKKVFFYENQELQGKHFRSSVINRPNYSDKNGIFMIDPQKIVLPKTWEWTGEWETLINNNTDSSGWMYGKQFDQIKKNYRSRSSNKRQRIWTRNCKIKFN